MPQTPSLPNLLYKRLVAIVFFGVLIAAVGSALFNRPVSAATSPSLGAASSFAILAGTPNITNVPTSSITGDVGLSPATGAAIGLTCAEVTGTIYQVDAGGPICFVTNPGLLTTAKADLTTAFNGLSAGGNAACTSDFGAVTQELSGLTLVPGVYCADAFQLSGPLPLLLDDTGSPDGVWIFRAELSTLNTTPANNVSVQFLTGVASSCNVWWKVSSSATIGSGTDFIGNILALTSISLGTGASLEGRALAQNGAVTLDSNTITAEECLPPTGPEATATQAAAATSTQAAAATSTQAAAATATQFVAATSTQAAAATSTQAAAATSTQAAAATSTQAAAATSTQAAAATSTQAAAATATTMPRPNLGGLFAPLLGVTSPAAAAPQPTATGAAVTTIVPPSTGDAGLTKSVQGLVVP